MCMRRIILSVIVPVAMMAGWSGCAATGDQSGTTCRCSRTSPPWKLTMMSYTWRTASLMEAIDRTQSLGIKYLEGYSGHRIGGEFKDMKLDYNSSPEARQAVKTRLAGAGVELVAYYHHSVGKDEPEARRIFEFCKDMGIGTIVGEPVPARLDEVEQLANEYGINVAIHNHAKPSTYWDPQFVLANIKDRGKRIGAYPDTGHWARTGLDTVEGLRKLEGRIIGMHFADVEAAAKKSRDVPWGTGVAQADAMLTELKRQGFSGLLSIEYEHNPDDNMADVAQCIAFYNKCVSGGGN